jgi:hypothetical protein
MLSMLWTSGHIMYVWAKDVKLIKQLNNNYDKMSNIILK